MPVQKTAIFFLLLLYVITLVYFLKEGNFGDKQSVVLIVDTGAQVQESEFSVESRVEKKRDSISYQNITDLDFHDSNSLNLKPPLQDWAASQMKKTMALLDMEYPTTKEWRECGPRTYYFPNINAIFTGIPKTGCTNWIIALLRAEGKLTKEPNPSNVNWVHGKVSYENRMNRVPDQYTSFDFQKAFSFAVVRNPWTRLVSGFRDKLSDENNQGPSLRFIGMSVVREIRGVRDRKLLRELYPTFEEFARYLVKWYGVREVNAHFIPQTDHLCLKHAIYDFIVPLEHSGSLGQEVLTKINASDTSLLGSYDKSQDPRHQKSTLFAKNWLSELDQDLIEQLYTIFKADFALLNYSNFTHPDFPLPLHNIEIIR